MITSIFNVANMLVVTAREKHTVGTLCLQGILVNIALVTVGSTFDYCEPLVGVIRSIEHANMRGHVPTREHSAFGDCADQLKVDSFWRDIHRHLQNITQYFM